MSESERKKYKKEIIKIVKNLDNDKIIDFMYHFIKRAVIVWH